MCSPLPSSTIPGQPQMQWRPPHPARHQFIRGKVTTNGSANRVATQSAGDFLPAENSGHECSGKLWADHSTSSTWPGADTGMAINYTGAAKFVSSQGAFIPTIEMGQNAFPLSP